MAYNPNILGDVLRARSISAASLSERLGLKLADLERELRDPSPKLLHDIARELALPPFVFYMRETPPLHDVLPDFRAPTPAPSSKTRETIESIQFAAGIQRAAAEGIGSDFELPSLPSIEPPQTAADVENLALSVRELLGISLQDQADADDARAFYVVCRKRIEDRGIFILHDSFPWGDGSGFCLYHSTHPLILINTNHQNWGRRLFTLIHELAHVLIHASGISDPFVTRNSVERFCNRFASAFLMPRTYVLKLLNAPKLTNDPDPADVRWVSNKLKISQEASVLRLEQLGLFKSGSREKWLGLIHNSGNPDWKNKRGGPSEKPPQQEKIKLAKYGFKFANEFARLLRDNKIDQVDIFRATGLKPKYQRPYFEYAASIGEAELRALELDDE